MAKVLVLFYQPIIDLCKPNDLLCFYESFISELSHCGNEVHFLNLFFVKGYNKDFISFLSSKNKENLIAKVKNINPDVIFTFNNQITREILNNTNCPVCLFDADGVNMFACKHLIKEYLERYKMFTFYKNWEIGDYKNIGFTNDKIYFLHMATSIKNENLPKDKNISFIGSNFWGRVPQKIPKDYIKQDLLDDLINYYNEPYLNFDKFYTKYKTVFKLDQIYSTLDSRLYILNSISDLGLKIYGIRWNELSDNFLNLKCAFDETPKYSLKHNSDIYNSSKICISISHPQCKGYAFPWRVYDIMASNGLLITTYSQLLKEEVDFELPMFKSPFEARELVKYALNNPNWCEDIKEQSNAFIEKNGRWKDNLILIGENLKLNLINHSEAIGELRATYSIETKNVKKYIESKRYKFKTFIYASLLICSTLPFIEVLFSKKLKNKIYTSLEKYKEQT